MAIAQRPERPRSTNNHDAPTATNISYGAAGGETQRRPPNAPVVSEEDEYEGVSRFTRIRATIERICHVITKPQERRKVRTELWHLARTDKPKFKAVTTTSGNAPDESALKGPEGTTSSNAHPPGQPPPPPPCLQCSLKDGRICSIQLDDGYERAVRCQQCRLDGEPYCLRQHRDHIRGGGDSQGKAQVDRWDLGRAAREPGYLPSRVYSQDNILQRDKPRLRALALALLRRYAYRIAATHLPPAPARRRLLEGPTGMVVLPMWHANDHPHNRGDPSYTPRTYADYFREVEQVRRPKRA